MSRLFAATALIGALIIAPALAQTAAPGNPPPAAAQKAPAKTTKAAKPHAQKMASGASMSKHGSKAGDNSADELNRQELTQMPTH
jgi:hypothetical protein